MKKQNAYNKPQRETRVHVHGRLCDAGGCKAAGEYKAPKSRASLREYWWFCLDHVRDYNKAWDYFSGLSAEEIDEFRKDAVTGHRPTWDRTNGHHYDPAMLEDALARMFGDTPPPQRRFRGVTQKERRAWEMLEFEETGSGRDLKKRYKELVKKYHPDVNKGDKAAEDRFKQVAAAYKFLMQKLSVSV